MAAAEVVLEREMGGRVSLARGGYLLEVCLLLGGEEGEWCRLLPAVVGRLLVCGRDS